MEILRRSITRRKRGYSRDVVTDYSVILVNDIIQYQGSNLEPSYQNQSESDITHFDCLPQRMLVFWAAALIGDEIL